MRESETEPSIDLSLSPWFEARCELRPSSAVTASMILFAVLVSLGMSSSSYGGDSIEQNRPNILWLSAEDISPHLGCYGDPHAISPALDRLASEGVRYSHAFTTAGVCAPCRSGIITGMYQTTLGSHHMRSNIVLPESVKPFPKYLRDAGYYCTNNSKTDYQFSLPKSTWDVSSGKAHWKNRPDPDQPFFAVFNFVGCHESGIASKDKYERVTKELAPSERQDAHALSTLPPYYPRTDIALEDWKRNYELITALDHWVDGHLRDLEEAGLADSTIVFFWSDHGIGLPRAKRWLYDSGTRIPLIIRTPEAYRTEGDGKPATVEERLISSIDLGPTVLSLAGIKVPNVMQGKPFLGSQQTQPREYVFGARDRMDERYDIIRMVRDKRFKYLRNYEPLKSPYQYINTCEKGSLMAEMRRLAEQQELPLEAARYFEATKPTEELYDTVNDPHELRNLAQDEEFLEELERLRDRHYQWVRETRDLGLVPEPLLVEFEREGGTRIEILGDANSTKEGFVLGKVAAWASEGAIRLESLTRAASSDEPMIRYWAQTGLGNLGTEALASKDVANKGLGDETPVVRIAAARAMCRMGHPREALPVLVQVLSDGEQWERLQAAIVLDEIGEQARPVIERMRDALVPREDLYAKGKYTVRVINRALNQLDGTSNVVP